MKFYTKFNIPKVKGTTFNKASLTDQSQAFDSDINNIVNNMALVPQQAKPPQFGCVFDANQFQQSLDIIADAKSQFEQLPASIRREFDNDISKFVNFIDSCSNDKGLASKAVKLGLAKPEILEKFTVPENKPTATVENQSVSVSEVSSN